MTLLISALQVAWPAFFFQQAKENDNRQVYSRALTYLVFIGTYLSLGLSALAQDTLIIVTTPAYYGAYKVVPLISLSYLLYGAYQITIIGPSLTRKTYLSSAIIGISAIVQTVLNFIIIPRYGMIGAGWTTLLSYALLIVLSVIVSNRIFPMTYEYLRLGKMMIMAGLLYLLSRLVVIQSPYVSFIVRGLIAGSFPIALFLTGFYNREEIRVLQIQVRKLVDRLLRRKPALSNIAEKENPD
jgi:O-antigen/teichoic acid export membrane protein